MKKKFAPDIFQVESRIFKNVGGLCDRKSRYRQFLKKCYSEQVRLEYEVKLCGTSLLSPTDTSKRRTHWVGSCISFCKRVSDVQYGIQAFAKFNLQNALDCISENFNLKNFPGGACARNSLQKCPFAVLMSAIAPILPMCTISLGPLYHKILRPPLWSVPFQNQKRMLLNSTKFEPNTLFSSSFNFGWLIWLPGSLKLLFIV